MQFNQTCPPLSPLSEETTYRAELHVGALGGGGIHGVAVETGIIPDRVARHAHCEEAGHVGRGGWRNQVARITGDCDVLADLPWSRVLQIIRTYCNFDLQ